ncbi:hypothetical protein [Carboxylicivirga sp. N1Y90]|uniref:hypothetical protein n=1 Tax=Carboxylicivirga fragile TaxID=3417571 RepID=UPI003D329255|nr:hypothetical protein [Marinilabiliaceae bacterium N1Y90]
MFVLNNTKKHLLNFSGHRLKKKYVLFESDDWGSERIPSNESVDFLSKKGVDVKKNPFNYLDSLESDDDLSATFEMLRNHVDHLGNHPVITANSVVANPDFEKIKASGFKEYHFEKSTDTYANKGNAKNAFEIIKQGMKEGVYHPQFHGREHVNVEQWLKALQSGNQVLLDAFNTGVFGIDLDIDLTNRSNFMAAFDAHSNQGIALHEDIVSEGTSMFEELYGFRSESFIAPCYVWHNSHNDVLWKNGIKYFQGLPVQLSPDAVKQYKRIYHYQGQKNKLGQRYFVRNCFFEPSLKPTFNWIDDVLNRLKIIFFWGKPAIIGTHRINFVGSLNEDNRKVNLTMLDELIKRMLKLWPDIEFITTDKLGNLYKN